MSLWVVTLGARVRSQDCFVGSCFQLFSGLPHRLLPVAVGQILTHGDPAALSYLQPRLWVPSGLGSALSWMPSASQPYRVSSCLLCLRCQ